MFLPARRSGDRRFIEEVRLLLLEKRVAPSIDAVKVGQLLGFALINAALVDGRLSS